MVVVGPHLQITASRTVFPVHLWNFLVLFLQKCCSTDLKRKKMVNFEALFINLFKKSPFFSNLTDQCAVCQKSTGPLQQHQHLLPAWYSVFQWAQSDWGLCLPNKRDLLYRDRQKADSFLAGCRGHWAIGIRHGRIKRNITHKGKFEGRHTMTHVFSSSSCKTCFPTCQIWRSRTILFSFLKLEFVLVTTNTYHKTAKTDKLFPNRFPHSCLLWMLIWSTTSDHLTARLSGTQDIPDETAVILAQN